MVHFVFEALGVYVRDSSIARQQRCMILTTTTMRASKYRPQIPMRLQD